MSSLNFLELLKQFQHMQKELENIKSELSHKKVTASVGGGMVEVTANGRQKIIDIKIEPEVFEENDKEMIEELVVAGVNMALEKAAELAKEEMNKAAGGLLSNLPEGIKIPGFNS